MSFQICQCGTQPGYLHDRDCPYPYFRDEMAGVNRWIIERDRVRRRREQAQLDSDLELDAADAAMNGPASRPLPKDNRMDVFCVECTRNASGTIRHCREHASLL